MQELERKLGYRFRSGALLAEALRHSSYANEHRGAESGIIADITQNVDKMKVTPEKD